VLAVLDASAAVELLLGTGRGDAGLHAPGQTDGLHAPDLLVSETVSVLRSLVLRREVTAPRAAGAVDDLHRLPITLWPTLPLADAAWEPRPRLTAYDALTRVLHATLMTCDGRLARTARTTAGIDVVGITAAHHSPDRARRGRLWSGVFIGLGKEQRERRPARPCAKIYPQSSAEPFAEPPGL
jgi:predicted nucleic acid-binding protein